MDCLLVIGHVSLQKGLKFQNFSLLKLSFLYQTSVFNAHIQASKIGLNDKYFNIKYVVPACAYFINKNGGFNAIGWYKSSVIMDQTMKY